VKEKGKEPEKENRKRRQACRQKVDERMRG